jgi:RimJ/RimL family protein N-acetyltransferase
MIFIETQRLLFRTHEAKDAADFVQMHTDVEVRRYVGGKAWSLEKAQQRFRNEYLGRPTETYGLWATTLKSEEKYVGCCGLRAAGPDAYLGYFLARPYWGFGLASEASKAFIDLAFDRLNLPRLLADVERGHTVSEHILQKFGFTVIGQEELTGNSRIILLYQLSRKAWEARRVAI